MSLMLSNTAVMLKSQSTQGVCFTFSMNRKENPMQKWSVLGLFMILMFPLSIMAHPLKLTASLIEYDIKTKSLNMECRVFRDDFQRSLNKSVLRNIDPSSLTRDGKIKAIESHFKRHYTIIHNGRTLPLKLDSSKYIRSQNVIVLKFQPNSLTLQKGDRLFIRNTLFFDDFKYAQSNRILIRIPHFSIDDQHVATLSNNRISYTLGALNQ